MKAITSQGLFKFDIRDWETWGKVYRSIAEFTPLVREIFVREGLHFTGLENCKPGTNGVFKVGKYIAKVFVPRESGYDSEPDYQAELFAMERTHALGVSAPRLVANGQIQDRYLFRYLVMDFVAGKTLGDIKGTLTKVEKVNIGEALRNIVRAWATPCENFNGIDVIARTLSSVRWQYAPAALRDGQKEYLESLKRELLVFVHGDLTEDNLIVDSNGGVTVLDFADSLCAPAIYEDMTVICDAFSFDKDFLKGYYGNISHDEIVEICVKATLCHEYGYHVVKSLFGLVGSVDEIRDAIIERLK